MRTTRYEEDPEAFPADAYKIRGYGDVAWHVLGWGVAPHYEEYDEPCAHCEGTGYDDDEDESCKKCEGTGKIYFQDDEPTYRRTGFIVARMVGDDRDFTLDADALIPINRRDYCGSCGQIGCEHDGMDREEQEDDDAIQR